MYVVTQNEPLWTADQWGAIAVSARSCCWWLFVLAIICPRFCLLSCSVVVLRCLRRDGDLRSWVAGGWEERLADKGLIILGKTSGAQEAEAGWLENQEARWCWCAVLGGSYRCKRRVRRLQGGKWQHWGNRDVDDWLISSAYHSLSDVPVPCVVGYWVQLGLRETLVGVLPSKLKKRVVATRLPAKLLQLFFSPSSLCSQCS